MGMMAGGGCGAQLAEWIVHGSPSLDMFSYDVSRFHEESNKANIIRDRTHESYAKTYAIAFPHDEPLAGREEGMTRKSGAHDNLARAGCVFQSRHGFERPGYFLPSLPTDEKLPTPKPYDYYGAYEEIDSAWRIFQEGGKHSNRASHVPRNETDPYLEQVEGELTFDVPASFEAGERAAADECEYRRG